MSLHTALAHNSIILYTLTPNEGDIMELEKLAIYRASLQLFVELDLDHEAQVDPGKEVTPADNARVIEQAKAWLAL